MTMRKLGLLPLAFVAATFAAAVPIAFDRGLPASNAAYARGHDDLSDLRDFICRRTHQDDSVCEP